jgi:hypothetical protein
MLVQLDLMTVSSVPLLKLVVRFAPTEHYRVLTKIGLNTATKPRVSFDDGNRGAVATNKSARTKQGQQSDLSQSHLDNGCGKV